VLFTAFSAEESIFTNHLYVEIHPSLDIDLDTIFDEVFLPI